MMRRAVWLVLVLVMHATSSQRIGIGKCPTYPAMKEMDLKKFEGPWYEVERSFYMLEMFATCTTLSFTMKSPTVMDVTVKSVSRLTGGPSISLGTAYAVKNNPAELDYRVKSKLPEAVARMMPGAGRYIILDTDYDNYAILWSCSNMSILHADLIWVLGRKRELPVSSRAEVYHKLTQLKLDSDRLTLSKQKNCPQF